MESIEVADDAARLIVRNVGGIDETEVSFSPGVTILAGRNATNRTSLLRSIMTGLGSEDMAIKGDADEGAVELTIGDETYTRTLLRAGRSVQFGGDPYLGDPEVADLFAFLLESNEARNAVVRNEDLRDLIVRPIDTEAIESRIEQLQHEERELDREEAKIEDAKDRIGELRAERESTESGIEKRKEELTAKEREIEEYDRSVDETKSGERGTRRRAVPVARRPFGPRTDSPADPIRATEHRSAERRTPVDRRATLGASGRVRMRRRPSLGD